MCPSEPDLLNGQSVSGWKVGHRVRWFGRTGTIDRISPEGIHYRISLDTPMKSSNGVTWTHRYAYGPEMELLGV